MDPGTFYIDTLIVHNVPRRHADGTGDPITLSEVPSNLETELRNFFRERIVRTLRRHAFDVEQDPELQSPVPGYIADLISDANMLVPASQAAANYLHVTQTGVNPPGLLVVARGTVDRMPCCSILKLEHEEALRIQQVKLDGQTTFDVAHLRDLMLGQNTRVFKASLFTFSGRRTDDVIGRVSDNQAGQRGGGVASFFLERFLGCRLMEAPKVSTRTFFEVTQEWINTLLDPVKRGRYEVGLIAQMHDSATLVTPNSFADKHFDIEDRASYRAHLRERGAPNAQFKKDTALIDSRIRQISIRFSESTVRVSGNPDDVDRYVRINERDSGAAPVEILDEVKEIRGGR